MAEEMNGEYIADGRTVRRAPTKTENGFKVGFPVCVLSDLVDDQAAQEIADALNLHRERFPEKH